MAGNGTGYRLPGQPTPCLVTLFTKLALYNTFIRLVLVGALWLVLPSFLKWVDYQHTDARLMTIHQRVLTRIEQSGIEPFINGAGEGRSNLLSEEYATLIPYTNTTHQPTRQFFDRPQAGNTLIDYRVLSHPIRIKGQLFLLEVGKSLNEVRELSQALGQLIQIGRAHV